MHRLEVGNVCFALQKDEYWPAKIVAYHDGGYTGPNRTFKKPKGPYEVCWYPAAPTAYLHREDICTEHDSDFAEIPLGQFKEARSSLRTEDIEAMLPDLVRVLDGKYAAAEPRHDLFFGPRFERATRLPQLVNVGGFSEEDTSMVSAYLLDWLNPASEHLQPRPAQDKMLARVPEQERPEYVAGVLMPLALELLYILDDETSSDRAVAALVAEDKEATDDSIREKEHELAVHSLKQAQSDDWWKKLYEKRQMLTAGKRINKEMKLSKKDMFGITGRRQATRKQVNYRD